jgi:hypothetical protein
MFQSWPLRVASIPIPTRRHPVQGEAQRSRDTGPSFGGSETRRPSRAFAGVTVLGFHVSLTGHACRVHEGGGGISASQIIAKGSHRKKSGVLP